MDTVTDGGGVKRKKKVYVESSVISYLTARDSTDVRKLTKQIDTRKWWEIRSRFDLYVSTVVLGEISRGDAEAARLRKAVTTDIKTLDYPQTAVDLAEQLVTRGTVPLKASADAAHIAIASVHGMDLILTWNHAHIANQNTLMQIHEVVKNFGFTPPSLVDPNFILEGKHAD